VGATLRTGTMPSRTQPSVDACGSCVCPITSSAWVLNRKTTAGGSPVPWTIGRNWIFN
jgi:hypothetical protein